MIWNDLIKIANLGTDRIDLDLSFKNDNISNILKSIDFKSNEEKLLNYSSILSIYQESGTLPEKIVEKIEPEKILIDDRKYTTFSDELINQIFEESTEYSNYNKLQEEFFCELIKRNEVIPDKFILKLLEIGSKNKKLSYYIGLTLSKLALFVSSKNTKWDYIYNIDEDIEILWDKSNKKVKLNITKKLLNYNSELLIKIITQSWDKLKKDEKEDLLDLINNDKSQHIYKIIFDLGLKDKNKSIEEKSEIILKNLNKKLNDYENILSDIYIVFDKSFKITESKNKGLIKIKIDIPDTFDKKLIDELNNGKPISNYQSTFFAELISIIPLSYWEKRFNLKPKEIIESFIINKLPGYLNHISFRAIKEKNNDWLESLFNNNINDQRLKNVFTQQFKEKKLKNVINSLPIEDIKNITTLNIEKNNSVKLSEKDQNLYNSYTYSINSYLANLSRVLILYEELSLEQSIEIFDALIFILKSGDFNYYNLIDIAYISDINAYSYIKEKIETLQIDSSENKYFFKDIFNVMQLRYKILEEFKK